MVAIAVSICVIGLVVGYTLHDFLWFSRFGALIVAVGVALLSRASVIGMDIKFDIVTAETGLSHLNPEHYRSLGQPIPDWVVEDAKS